MSDQRPATVTGERPDPDPLYVSEERRRETERAERNVWLGLLALVIIAALLGAVALVLIASRPTSATSRSTPDATSTALAYSGAPLGSDRDGTPPVNDVAAATSLAVGAPLQGYATWYDAPPGTAAAGPDLRAWLGDWRGRVVTVSVGGRSVTVALTDACWCPARNGVSVLVDLSRTDFAKLAAPSIGVLRVRVSGAVLPNTDTVK